MSDKAMKIQIREYLLQVRKYLNLSGISREVGISRQVLSFFLKDEYHLYVISLEKLQKIVELIKSL